MRRRAVLATAALLLTTLTACEKGTVVEISILGLTDRRGEVAFSVNSDRKGKIKQLPYLHRVTLSPGETITVSAQTATQRLRCIVNPAGDGFGLDPKNTESTRTGKLNTVTCGWTAPKK